MEEWYHSRWFNVSEVLNNQSNGPSSLSEGDLDPLLSLFKNLKISSTFFILGNIAERLPRLIEKILAEGHEIGCHGYDHNSVHELGSAAFKEHVEKSRRTLWKVTRETPLGYRAPNFRITTQAINILEDIGFRYDSSIVPCLKVPGWYGYPSAPLIPYRPNRQDMCKINPDREFFEVPIAVHPFLRLPGGGGWYLRNLGYSWTKTIVKSLLKRGPVTLYIHPWETSNKNSRIKSIPLHVFRRTGQYVTNAIRDLVKDVGIRPITIREFLEKNGW